MHTLGSIILGVALISTAACKPANQRRADRAADRAVHAMDNFDQANTPSSIVAKSFDIVSAVEQFELRRNARVDALSAQRSVIATQPELISTLADAAPLTTAGREAVDAKIQTLDLRLDDMANQLNELRSAGPDDWRMSDDATTAAMKQLDDARADAWQALQNAPRLDRQS